MSVVTAVAKAICSPRVVAACTKTATTLGRHNFGPLCSQIRETGVVTLCATPKAFSYPAQMVAGVQNVAAPLTIPFGGGGGGAKGGGGGGQSMAMRQFLNSLGQS